MAADKDGPFLLLLERFREPNKVHAGFAHFSLFTLFRSVGDP
jgi:hypothetical protein